MEMFDCVSHYGKSFEYCRDGGCIALTEMLCRNGVCKFYKNAFMREEQRKKCSERIAGLVAGGARVDEFGRVHT